MKSSTIIVDNTNIKPKEFQDYLDQAHEHGYKTMVRDQKRPMFHQFFTKIPLNEHVQGKSD